jgi:hypothetical protein
MIYSRKKPGVAFWATVAVVVVLIYPISFGPACWINERTAYPDGKAYTLGRGHAAILALYRPIFQWAVRRPPGSRIVYWYAELGTRNCSLGISYDGRGRVSSYDWMRDSDP